MYVIMSTDKELKNLEYAVQHNDEFLDKHNLTYSYLFKPMVKDFEVYQEIDIVSDNNANNRINGPEVSGNNDGKSTFGEKDQMTYNHTEKIMKEGVYYVSFLYEIMDQ